MRTRAFPWSPVVVAGLVVALVAPSWLSRAAGVAGLRALPSAARIDVTLDAAADSGIDSADPDRNLGNGRRLNVAYTVGRPPRLERALLRFDLSSKVPGDAVIDAARLEIYLIDVGSTVTRTLSALLVTSDWDERGVTWNNQPDAGDPSVDAAIGISPAYYGWDVTALARSWQLGRNFGVMVRGTESGAVSWSYGFVSREMGERPPRLIVTYHLPGTETLTPGPDVSSTPILQPSATTGTDVSPTAVLPPTATTAPVVSPTTVLPPSPTPEGPQVVIDSWVDMASTSANHGDDEGLDVALAPGPESLPDPARWALVQFDLEPTPGAYITRARLRLHGEPVSDPGPEAYPITALRLTSRWSEMDVTFLNVPDWVATEAWTTDVPSADGDVEWDLTGMARRWIWEPEWNFGLILMHDGTKYGHRRFASSETANPPRLIVNYTSSDHDKPSHPIEVHGDRPTGTWSNQPDITMSWSGAQDDTSGVHGYAYQWSTSPVVPDAVEQTLSTSVKTTIPGDGSSWYFYVRSVDAAGNWADQAQGAGPFWLDTQPPARPASVSGERQPQVWSADALLAMTWSAGYDPTSGVHGYSVQWSASPILPDGVEDTTATNVEATIPADGKDWWFYVRSVDRAGNWSTDARSIGPFYLDTEAPTTAIAPLLAFQDGDKFVVSWSGTDAGVGLRDFDVQLQDNGGPWIDWQVPTTAISAQLTGARGHVYGFRCRARDHLGNTGAFTALAEVTTSVGRGISVRVENESAMPLPGAKVFHNGQFLALTGSDGTATAPNCLAGDTFSALYVVQTSASAKYFGGWRWHVYLTSVPLLWDGTPLLYTLGNVDGAGGGPPVPVLTVRREQTLIGFHPVVSVEWKATPGFMADLAAGLQLASNYLYDAGDGQFFFEQIDIVDEARDWTAADIRIYTTRNVWPHVDKINGLDLPPGEGYMFVPRYFAGRTGELWGDPTDNNWRVFIHEWGHLAMSLWDEYLNRDGEHDPDAFCASGFDEAHDLPEQASVMYNEFRSSEFCSRVDPSHLHRPNTYHDYKSAGQSTWETIQQRFSSGNLPWRILRPDDRGHVVSGPNAVPVPGWTTIQLLPEPGSNCGKVPMCFSLPGGEPAAWINVWLVHGARRIDEGTTDEHGCIDIVGARSGDSVEGTHGPTPSFFGGLFGQVPIWCQSSTTAHRTGQLPLVDAQADDTPVELRPNAFALEVRVVPSGSAAIRVEATTGATLAGGPIASVQQGGAESPFTHTLTLDPGRGIYVSEFVLDRTLDRSGLVVVEARDAPGRTVIQYAPYGLADVAADEIIVSADGAFELVLRDNGYPDGTVVSVQPGQGLTGALPSKRTMVGNSYEVVAAATHPLGKPATVRIYYSDGQLEGRVEDTLRIYRYDEGGGWESLGGTVVADLGFVQVKTDRLAPFALFAEPAPHLLSLPLMYR